MAGREDTDDVLATQAEDGLLDRDGAGEVMKMVTFWMRLVEEISVINSWLKGNSRRRMIWLVRSCWKKWLVAARCCRKRKYIWTDGSCEINDVNSRDNNEKYKLKF